MDGRDEPDHDGHFVIASEAKQSRGRGAKRPVLNARGRWIAASLRSSQGRRVAFAAKTSPPSSPAGAAKRRRGRGSRAARANLEAFGPKRLAPARLAPAGLTQPPGSLPRALRRRG
ncbi:hypothetical protein SLNSH_13740 [Alsobacter soli]|uniref:Uncharacterized protein n=1 Tax=Alsobacter soli TaxID=2109933 RepID=A0A2T1HSB6_9HYPH|nr:hypothetical protein SLNSH_13740 [Alsobacter soli]